MKCSTHLENNNRYKCHLCGKHLCASCKPVSFQGQVYCLNCADIAEERDYTKKVAKEIAMSRFSTKNLLFVSLFLIFFGTGYYFFAKPKEVNIKVDDRERIQFYLDLAFDAGKGSKTYNRQMHNIFRLSSKYENVISFIEKGLKHYEKDNYRKSIFYLEKIGKMLPDWYLIYALIARSYVGLKNYDEAKPLLKQSISLNPEGTKPYVILGDIYASEGNYKSAILQYSKAYFNDNKNSSIILGLAELYIKDNKLMKAREFREKAHKLGANTDLVDKLINKV